MNFADIAQQQRDWDERARKAQAGAAQAYERLVAQAERSDTGQAGCAARFVAATSCACAPRGALMPPSRAMVDAKA